MKNMRNNKFGRRTLFNLSNLDSIVLSDRYKEIKKMGIKLMKYREEIKWLIFNNLQSQYVPAIGENIMIKRTPAFLLYFDDIRRSAKRVTEIMVTGKLTVQSWTIQYKTSQKE
jgi:hypothetical protein